jgi:hypothetical protein
MRLILSVLMYAQMTYSAFALGYPTPQEKPRKEYWDSKLWHERIAKDPNTLSYLASPHEIIAKSKKGQGVLITHNEKGCLVIQHLHPLQVDKLLTKQGDA